MTDEIYRQYMNDVTQYPRITVQEEKDLSYIIVHSKNKKKVKEAVDKMVVSNLLLAAKFAMRAYQYNSKNSSIKMSLMDYIQEANKALMRAAEHYDAENSDARFGTYAVPAIRNGLIKAAKHSRFVRIPEHQFNQISAIEKLYIEHDGVITDEMIMEELEISKKYLSIIKGSYNSSILPNHVDSIADMFISPAPSSLSNIKKKELKEYLLAKIKELSPMERDAVFFMFFGDTSAPVLAKKHGVTHQRISQAIISGLKKLRKKIGIEKKITKENL